MRTLTLLTLALVASACSDGDGPAGDAGAIMDAGGADPVDAGEVIDTSIPDAGDFPKDDAGPTACATDGTCPSGMWCDFVSDACGGPGLCMPVPMGCSRELAPVCGCDGMDYSNPCLANNGGTDVAHAGMCPSPADCRTTGCPMGSYCGECLSAGGSVWVCLDDGTAC